jgi:hypothetical protein
VITGDDDPFADRLPEWIPAPQAPREARAPSTPETAGPAQPVKRGAARKRRARRIRLFTISFALTGFFAVWSVVYTQMAAGDDPALRKSGASAVPATIGTAASSNSSAAPSTDSPSVVGAPAAAPQPTAVTSSQS